MSYQQKIEISNNGGTNWTDITGYVALGGLKYSRNDIDASNSGRSTQNGQMHRARVSVKIRLDVTCRPLTDTEASTVLQLIYPQWVTVRFYDPRTGATVTKTMYSNNVPATYLMYKNNQSYWNGISFPLIER